ncbi:alkaline phosphatase family protein [Amycolatopsis sp. NPDC051372]|uniref:alkaline phosphatase family protein n=1 Tax=Amycolatopsis sp. NPDC051372 TaxID=3155669 RepID=UPI0034148F99
MTCSASPTRSAPTEAPAAVPRRHRARRRPDLGDLAHDWATTHQAWANGAYDAWVPAKTEVTMSYFNREDLPFRRALASAFTLCDNDFCLLQARRAGRPAHAVVGGFGAGQERRPRAAAVRGRTARRARCRRFRGWWRRTRTANTRPRGRSTARLTRSAC